MATGIVEATERLYRALFAVALGYGVVAVLWGIIIAPFNRYDHHRAWSVGLGLLLAAAWVPALRSRQRVLCALRRQPLWLLVPVAVGAATLWVDSGWRSVFYLASYAAIPLAAVTGGLRWSLICGALLAVHYFAGLAVHGWMWGQPAAFKEPDSAVANTGGYLIAAYFLAAPVAWLGGYVARINQVLAFQPAAPIEASPGEASAKVRLRTARLTVREVETTQLVAGGLSNDEIAARLVLSPRTVQSHVANALKKTGCRNRTELGLLAQAEGLLP